MLSPPCGEKEGRGYGSLIAEKTVDMPARAILQREDLQRLTEPPPAPSARLFPGSLARASLPPHDDSRDDEAPRVVHVRLDPIPTPPVPAQQELWDFEDTLPVDVNGFADARPEKSPLQQKQKKQRPPQKVFPRALLAFLSLLLAFFLLIVGEIGTARIGGRAAPLIDGY